MRARATPMAELRGGEMKSDFSCKSLEEIHAVIRLKANKHQAQHQMVRQIQSQRARTLKPHVYPSKHADACVRKGKNSTSDSDSKCQDTSCQQRMATTNSPRISQPYSHLERQVVFDHYIHQPCQKVKENEGR